MKKKFKIIFVVSCGLIALTILVLSLNIDVSVKEKFADEISFKANNTLEIESSTALNGIGNYIFLMSPHPIDEGNEDQCLKESFLIVTDMELNILDRVKLGGYYEKITSTDNGFTLYSSGVNDNQYLKKLSNPRIQKSTLGDGGKLGNLVPIKDDEFTVPENPYPMVGQGTLGIYDENKFIEIADPYFKIDGYDYLVTDFIQNNLMVKKMNDQNNK